LSITPPPEQKVVEPDAVIEMVGTELTVKEMEFEVVLPQAFVTMHLYVPLVVAEYVAEVAPEIFTLFFCH
jgi:hypothetical protein